MTRTLAVTLLGTGSPHARANRVSSGAVVSIDGRACILIDAGGGTLERLAEARINPADIDLLAVTHTHIDHSGEIAPIVFAAAIAERKRTTHFVGPAGREIHPGARKFVDLLFGERGAWSYLHTFDGFGIEASEMPSDTGSAEASAVDVSFLEVPGLRMRSTPVPHGMMPSLAYRVDYAGRSVTFSGDISRAAPSLIALAQGSDLLVHDMALPERNMPNSNLHAKPSAVGEVAAQAGVGHLILTHFMPAIEAEFESVIALIRKRYEGRITIAHDVQTVLAGA